MAGFNLEEEVSRLNVTLEELDAIQKANSEKKFTDTASLVEYLQKIRDAQYTTTKPNNQIYFDEIKESWNTVKDAQDGLLGGIKQKLLTKSEEMLSGDTSQIDETNAAELDEWLKINDMRDDLSEEQKKRNKELKNKIKAFYKEFDRENGLEDLSPKDQLRIVQTQTELNEMKAEAFPYRQEDGRLVANGEEFKEIVDFYTKLQLTDDNGRQILPVDKAKFIESMVTLAQNESMTQLSLDKDFAAKSAAEKQQIFKQSVAANMQAGIVELLVAKTLAEMTDEQRQNIDRNALEAQAREKLANLASQESISMPHKIALSSTVAAYAHLANMNKRISQKTDNTGFFKKAKAKFAKFAEEHPKIANVAKIMGTIGLTAGLAMTAGSAGMAALGVYRTYKAVRKGVKETGGFKKMLKSPRHMIAVGTALAGTVIAGYGAIGIGGAANGMIGHALGGGMDGAAGETAQKLAQQRLGRLFVGAGSALARLSVDIVDAVKKTEHKGQRTKAILKALGNTLLHGGIAVAAYEFGTHQAAAHTAETPAPEKTVDVEAANPSAPVQSGEAIETSPEGYTESPENLQRWENRIDQFLGKTEQGAEIKDRIYGMIDKGEVKLPEGIETKEEYLYKMVMKMEQRPDDLRVDLGDEFKSTLSREQTLMSMTADDFNKVSHDLNSYSDTGEYMGQNSNDASNKVLHEGTRVDSKPLPQDETPSPIEENKAVQETISTPTPEPVAETSNVPSHARMNEFNQHVRAEYKQSHNFDSALQKSLQEALKEGSLKPEEAAYTEQIFRETYQAHHENPLATFKDIDKTSAELAAKESASTRGEDALSRLQNKEIKLEAAENTSAQTVAQPLTKALQNKAQRGI